MPATELTPGTIDYEGTGGHGPVIVLPGGVLMVGSVWEPVVAKPRHDHRCVVSMPPLGSPGRPMRADADLSLRGFGRIAAALLERLDLREVTLVGNDHAVVPAWLVTRHYEELRPLMASWRSTADGGYFGGSLHLAPGAARCDASPAWLSWVGAGAAIELLSRLPAATAERHCLALAAAFREGALDAGATLPGIASPSHIVTVRVRDPEAVSARLRSSSIRARMLGDRLRVGFHYFNNDEDVAAVLHALRV
jgi:hypothetical protein